MLTKQIQQRYFNFPVKNGAEKRQVNILIEGQLVREFSIELAEDTPDFWVFLDMQDFRGKTALLQIFPPLDEIEHPIEPLIQSDNLIGAEDLYQESLRPQIHFTARRGWLNDPNGLVYSGGVYHLFFQHNPFGVKWGNMHWGHAVSPDLVHWQELPEVLYPDETGTMFSGSAVTDWNNTSGLQQGAQPPIVLLYTAAGDSSGWSKGQPFTQCLAYSSDGGQTYHKYAQNPVLGWVEGANRDPKVIWHAPSQRWVMALYLEEDRFSLFTSPDLIQWQSAGSLAINGCSECPDIFELPLDGDPRDMRWVLWAANASYLIGQFDGQHFQVEEEVLDGQFGSSAYAAQTYSDIPAEDGRRIQFSWLRGDLSCMPFNQQMAFPVYLALRSTPRGMRLFFQPVPEITQLRAARHVVDPQPLHPGANPLGRLALGEGTGAYELNMDIVPGDAARVGLVIGGVEVAYDSANQTLTSQGRSAPLVLSGGSLALRVLVDRASLEIFANQGEVYLPLHADFPLETARMEVFARGGTAQITQLDVFPLRSAWQIG